MTNLFDSSITPEPLTLKKVREALAAMEQQRPDDGHPLNIYLRPPLYIPPIKL